MSTAPSFTGRILLALVLMVGFYVLALAVVGGLLFIPYAEITYAHKIHPKLLIFCLIIAGMILWSVMPRFDHFTPPGPRLTEEDQPDLFREIREIAQATGQQMPAEVYAVPEMNAWVSNRGGVMGLGSRRVMGLGVPLMQVLSRQQFRAVLAHEFGHYHAGDTKLGPWIFVTRTAILRTVINLQGGSSFVSKPFELYLKMFLWITQSVSRHQEFVADALGAKVAGPQALISGLKVIHSSAQAFDAYWSNEYVPVLGGGFRAPLIEGFQVFYDLPRVQNIMQESLAAELKSDRSDPYDSHPPLRERIAALEKAVVPQSPDPDPPFISSLRNLDRIEVQMIEHLAKAVQEKMPEHITWENVAEKIWIPTWQQNLAPYNDRLKGLTVLEVGRLLGDPKRMHTLFVSDFEANVPPEIRSRIICTILQSALTIALYNNGWKIETPVGSPVYATRDGQKLEHWDLLANLVSDKPSFEDYERALNAAGVADLPLLGSSQPVPANA